MERTVHKSRSFQEAEEWDIRQQLAMTPGERIQAAREMQRRFYGDRVVGLREWAKGLRGQ